MRILFACIGTYGDVLPFIGLAAELQRRGHEVALASAATFEMATRRAGVPFEPLMSAADYEELFEHPDFWRPFVGARKLFSALPGFLEATHGFIVRRNRPGDTLVVASALALGARVANETDGVPVVSVHLTPIMFVSREEAPRRPFVFAPKWLPAPLRWRIQTGLYTDFIAPLVLPGLNAFRARFGLKRKRKVRSWWHASQLTLLMFPDWFARPQPEWPKQAVQLGFPRADLIGAKNADLDERLDAFLDDGSPPVAITFGSARFANDRLYRAAIEACARIGRRCVVLSHQPIELPEDLARIAFAARYAPLGEVLPRCAALVHHGGVGTTALGFAAAVPQLVVPIAFDQLDHAARVERLGCGVSIARRRFTAGRAAEALKALVASPVIAARCAEAAKACKGTDAVADASDAIERAFGTAADGRKTAACS